MDYEEIVTEWRALGAIAKTDPAAVGSEDFAARSIALGDAIEALKETDPAGYDSIMAEVYVAIHPPTERYVVGSPNTEVSPAAESANGVEAVESIHERDERIVATMIDAVREYIENLPKEVVQHDEAGNITSRKTLRFEGTEFPVATARGQFVVSIYPAPYSRRESGRDD